ncbi:hypothetical protein AB4144_60945, partial [Rhizobiaceae sp. 2RAB30]
LRLPVSAITVRGDKSMQIFKKDTMRTIFLEYESYKKQIKVTGFPARQVPHKGLTVNCILHFKTMD